MSKKPHWTQTPEGKARMSIAQKKVWAEKRSPLQRNKKFKQLAKNAMKAKRGPYKQAKKEKKPTSLVVNGWRITLGKDEVKIEHE